VFFRTGQVALLEKFRQEVISKAAVVIQKTYRGFVARRRYQQIREAILHIQVSKFFKWMLQWCSQTKEWRGNLLKKFFTLIRMLVFKLKMLGKLQGVPKKVEFWNFLGLI
jgi:myosin heavy subunit